MQNTYCKDAKGLLFVVSPNISMVFKGNHFCMNLLIGPVMVGLIGLKPNAVTISAQIRR